jgi:hypothetical protein
LFAYNQAQKIEKVNEYGDAASASSFSEVVGYPGMWYDYLCIVHYLQQSLHIPAVICLSMMMIVGSRLKHSDFPSFYQTRALVAGTLQS